MIDTPEFACRHYYLSYPGGESSALISSPAFSVAIQHISINLCNRRSWYMYVQYANTLSKLVVRRECVLQYMAKALPQIYRLLNFTGGIRAFNAIVEMVGKATFANNSAENGGENINGECISP